MKTVEEAAKAIGEALGPFATAYPMSGRSPRIVVTYEGQLQHAEALKIATEHASGWRVSLARMTP